MPHIPAAGVSLFAPHRPAARHCFFFFKGSAAHRDLPSSPPRRSPDLPRVAKTQEDGGGRGSGGGRSRGDRGEGERAVLRSHTTPITLHWLMEHPDPPQKAFIIGR